MREKMCLWLLCMRTYEFLLSSLADLRREWAIGESSGSGERNASWNDEDDDRMKLMVLLTLHDAPNPFPLLTRRLAEVLGSAIASLDASAMLFSSWSSGEK